MVHGALAVEKLDVSLLGDLADEAFGRLVDLVLE
jgi:hypothetical protein